MKNLPGTVPDKLQPHNVEAEEGTLGGILVDSHRIEEIIDWLTPEMFFVERNKWIYEAMISMHERGEPAGDLLLLTDELEKQKQLNSIGGSAYLTGLINATPTSMHTTWYARKVRNCGIARRYIIAAGKIVRAAYAGESPSDDDIFAIQALAESELFEAAPDEIQEAKGWRHISEVMGDNIDRLEAIKQGASPGYLTGLKDLDKILGGVQPSDMVVIAGRPGMGKTLLALQILSYWAKNYGGVGLLSLEMSDMQLGQRLWSADSLVDSTRIRLGNIHEEEWAPLLQSAQKLSELPIYIDDQPAITAPQLISKSKRLVKSKGAIALVVDYLQLMHHGMKGNLTQTEAMTVISNTAKRVARELNIPVVALSQLSRAVESRGDKRPILSDLRQSGSIEQDADAVLFIYRDEIYNPDTEFPNIAEIIVGKFRHGPTGVFSVYFKKAVQQFVDLEVRTQPLNY